MRVIAGRLGGRALRAPKGDSTRPTSDRVREALFQVLGDLTGARVLDCYAGTGALGIEAASRGAVHVTFVEANRGAVTALRGNLTALGLTASTRVLPTTVQRASRALANEEPFDLILSDAPWAQMDQALADLHRVLQAIRLTPGARVVVEHAARSRLNLPAGWSWAETDRRVWGDTAVSIFQPEG